MAGNSRIGVESAEQFQTFRRAMHGCCGDLSMNARLNEPVPFLR
jgi:hypothetical protein